MTPTTLMILIILIVFSLFMYNNFKIENFEVVGYNTSDVPKYTIPNSYDIDSKKLQDVFKEVSKNEDLDTSTYTLYSNYIEFPLNNIIKTFLIDYLTMKFNNKIEINTAIYNMYWKDIGLDRLFIFNVNMFNRKIFTARNLKVKIIIKQIKNFTKDTNIQDYKTNILPKILINSISILSISINNNNNTQLTTIGIDNLDPDYYRIKNRLFLMDPFITSNADMIISNSMKDTFALSLIEHQKKKNKKI